MDFGAATKALISGRCACRLGWNGKGMFLFYVPTWTYTDSKLDGYSSSPFIALKTADNKVVPWPASQTDILAEDWVLA